jgi:hypothetical protein
VSEELLETEAIELPEADADEPAAEARPLPVAAPERSDLPVISGEVKTAALAAAGGLVAGAATVAVVRATRNAAPKRRSRRALRKERPQNIIASRSFLVDVHLLGQK